MEYSLRLEFSLYINVHISNNEKKETIKKKEMKTGSFLALKRKKAD